MISPCLWKLLTCLLTTLECETHLWKFSEAHLNHTAYLCNNMGKSKEISQDVRRRTVDVHQSRSSLRATSRGLKGPRSGLCLNNYVQLKYKHHEECPAITIIRIGGAWVLLCFVNECILVLNVHVNPRLEKLTYLPKHCCALYCMGQ